jgi:hypothetical protein
MAVSPPIAMTVIEVTLYALAVVGMAGVWLVPARLWTIVVKRKIGVPLSFQPTALVGAMPVVWQLPSVSGKRAVCCRMSSNVSRTARATVPRIALVASMLYRNSAPPS